MVNIFSRSRLLFSISAFTAVFCTFPALAQDSAPKWGPHIEAEGKWGTDRSLGEIGAFVPVWQDEDTLFFGDIRGKLDDDESSEGNFGFGVRQQINNSWALGGYAFYDYRRTPNDNNFQQATIGAEALSENLEFRVNGYIPEAGSKNIAGTGGSAVTASANGGNLQLVITTTGATKERALPGVDIEAGYKFNIPGNWEFWAYAGGFHFDADGYENISGPRGRLELSYNNVPYLGEDSKFTLGLEAQTDDVRGGQTFGIARLRIPLNTSTAKDRAPLSALDKRMTTRIVRDIDIVSGESTPTVTTTTEAARATLGSGAQVSTYTVIDAADNIITEVNNAGDDALIVLDGTAGTIDTAGDVLVRDGQTIISGTSTLSVTGVTSGSSATLTLPGTRATVNNTSGVVNNTFIFDDDDNVTLQGFDITGGASAIQVENTSSDNLVFRDLTMDGMNGAFFIINATNVDISDITATNLNIHAIRLSTVVNTISFSNVSLDTIGGDAVNMFGATAVVTNPSGAITATNVGLADCNTGGGATVTGSTLLINGVLCN